MNRRRFLLGSVTVLVGGYVAGRLAGEWHISQFSVESVELRLRALLGKPLMSFGAWQPAQIFSHLAQSIEYSMEGYPQSKPAWFQHSAGTLAFTAFGAAGAMTHNLSEPIPGAPDLHDVRNTDFELNRLLAALQRFEAHSGDLAAHFAYGALDKRQYRAAHLMHIENHLSELHGVQTGAN